MTIKDPKAPATPAQTSYLESLVTQRDLPAVCERYALLKGLGAVTKGQASAWINELLAAPKKTAKTPAQAYADSAQAIAAAYVAPAPVCTPQLIVAIPTAGYYEIDGTLYNWEQQKKDYSIQLRKLVLPTTSYWGGTTKAKWMKVYTKYGTSTKIGSSYVPNFLLEAVAAGAKPMTMEQAAAKGKALNFCVKCGAQLTDPVSVANGIGPVCAKTGMWA